MSEKEKEFSGQLTDYYQSHIFSKFLDNFKLAYSDFQSTTKEYQFHKAHNFNWENHGYDLLKEIN